MALVFLSSSSCQKFSDMLGQAVVSTIVGAVLDTHTPDPRTDNVGFRAIIDTAEVFASVSIFQRFGVRGEYYEDDGRYYLVSEQMSLVNKNGERPIIKDSLAPVSFIFRVSSNLPFCSGQQFVFDKENTPQPYHRLGLGYKTNTDGFRCEYSGYGLGTLSINKMEEKWCEITINAVFYGEEDDYQIPLSEGLLICSYSVN